MRNLIGNRIRQLREERGYTQDRLAKEVLSGATAYKQKISRIEKGQTQLGIDDLAKLATFFNVTSDYIMGLVDEPDERLSLELTADERELLLALRERDYGRTLQLVGTIMHNSEDVSGGAA